MGCSTTKQPPSQRIDRNAQAWPRGRSVDHLGLALVGAGAEGDPGHHGVVGGGAGGWGQDQEEEGEEREGGRHCGWWSDRRPSEPGSARDETRRRGEILNCGIPISKAPDPRQAGEAEVDGRVVVPMADAAHAESERGRKPKLVWTFFSPVSFFN